MVILRNLSVSNEIKPAGSWQSIKASRTPPRRKAKRVKNYSMLNRFDVDRRFQDLRVIDLESGQSDLLFVQIILIFSIFGVLSYCLNKRRLLSSSLCSLFTSG